MRSKTNLDDSWYVRHNVEPPRRFQHGTEEEVQQGLKASREGLCSWKARGNDIFCDRHSFGSHGRLIPVDMRLVGTDEHGRPILKKIQVGV